MDMFWKNHGIEKRDLLIPASLLLGFIILSLSILWVGGKLGGESFVFGSTNTKTPGPTAGAIVKITDRKDAPRIGAGKVELVVFSDFQCPFCQSFVNGAYKEIKQKYVDTGKVKLIFRHYPLSFHINAQKSGEAAECANRQGQFFPYHDILFAKAKSDGAGLDNASLKQYAKDLGLDTTKFNSCLDNGEAAAVVKADFAEGQKVGVSGTPTIFINGIKVVGAAPFANFETIIEAELKK